MKSLLLITDGIGLGGAEIAMFTAAEALARKGLRVSVGVPLASDRVRQFYHGLEVAGVKVIEADGALSSGPLGLAAPLFRRDAAQVAARIVAKASSDAVIVNLPMLWAGSAIVDAARASGSVRRLGGYVQLGKLPSRMGARWGWLRDRLITRHMRRFDVLLAVSTSQGRDLASLEAGCRVVTVFQPVRAVQKSKWMTKAEAQNRLGIAARHLVGVPGRVVFRHKGQDLAVQAAELLRRSGLDVHWVVVGDGPDLDGLQALVRNAGLTDQFHFLGWRSDLAEILPAFDVLAMPSHFEGLPLTAVEGMCARVPVVAFGVDGLSDLLEPPFLVPPCNTERFAATIAQVLTNSDCWPGEERARVAAQLCDPDAVAERIMRALGLAEFLGMPVVEGYADPPGGLT